MGHHVAAAPTPCHRRRAGQPCLAYWPGHLIHLIHLTKVGESPWGWRDAVVTAGSAGGWLEAGYLTGEEPVALWHHDDLAGEIPLGSPVRVHERHHALSGSFGVVNVEIVGGAGSVPDPEHPETWAQEMSRGVVDLATGRGVLLGAAETGTQR